MAVMDKLHKAIGFCLCHQRSNVCQTGRAVSELLVASQSNANGAGELTCVVVDELHMVCDPNRGLPLELSITKLLFSRYADRIQLIGMSATMGGEQMSCHA